MGDLTKGPAIPAPHSTRRVRKFDVGAVWGDTQGGLNLGTEFLAHGLGFAAHGAHTFDFDVAGGVSAAPKGHGSAGLKRRHHIGFWFTNVFCQASG